MPTRKSLFVFLFIVITSSLIILGTSSRFVNFVGAGLEGKSQIENINSTFYRLASNLPSYKGKRDTNSDAESSFTMNLPIIKISAADVYIKADYLTTSDVDNSNLKVSCKYNKTLHRVDYVTSIQSFSNLKYTLQSNKSSNQSSNEIQSAGIFEDKTQSVFSPKTKSFLTNNTLTISTDLSENNSPKLVVITSNPGDPGIPIGDGIWILLAFAGLFASNRFFYTLTR